MEENRKKTIRIGEFLLCIFLTVLITATLMVILYTYLLEDKSQEITTSNMQQNGVHQENLQSGSILYNTEKEIANVNNQVTNNEKNERKYEDAIADTITLNNKQYNVSVDFHYGEQVSEDLANITMRIKFNSEYIRYIDTYRYTDEVLGEENVKFNIVQGYDEQEFLILETNFAATPTWDNTVLYIIDESGNITSTLLFTGGMGMELKSGEDLSYKVGNEYKYYSINNNFIEWYEYNEKAGTQDIVVVKYKAEITENGLLDIIVEQTYNSEQIQLSGKV